jgi:hypothetical protein
LRLLLLLPARRAHDLLLLLLLLGWCLHAYWWQVDLVCW